MNVYEFKNKINNFYKFLLKQKEKEHEDRMILLLKQLIESICLLKDFFDDKTNINLLNNYFSKIDANSELYPLDNLCGKIVEILIQIDGCIDEKILDRFVLSDSEINISTSSFLHEAEINNIIFLINEPVKKIFDAFSVLKHLDGHNKTLIILGPNGSGKSSFAKYMSTLDNHIKVIPANKPIMAVGHIPSMYLSSLNDYNAELYKGGILEQTLLQKLIVGMCSEHDDVSRKYMETGQKNRNTIYEKVKKLFDDFFDVCLDSSAFSEKKIMVKNNYDKVFDFNNMSDGERAAFFYISTVITAPEKSFIIVDEPENHLNPAVYNKIWDKLIEVRSDCQFIFISHTMDFVCARTNYEIIKIKNFRYPNEFEFVFVGNQLDDIDSNLIVEIMGSRKPIMFCEGNKSSLDYKIYERLFGEKYTVIPAGNCYSVQKNVEACNSYINKYIIQDAVGIVDSDLKSDKEINDLLNKKIYVLKCNEIELLMVDENVLERVLDRVYKKNDLEEFKEKVFEKINKRKDYIIKRIIKKRIEDYFHSTFIDDKLNNTPEKMKVELQHISSNFDVEKEWEKTQNEIELMLSQKKYDDALRICCLEHKEITGEVGDKYVKDYLNMAINIIKEDDSLCELLINKYFSGVI